MLLGRVGVPVPPPPCLGLLCSVWDEAVVKQAGKKGAMHRAAAVEERGASEGKGF